MIFFDTLDSTNRYAKEHFGELEDGELVVAATQTAGRGRLNRTWFSPRGNVYASCAIRVKESPFAGIEACSVALLDLLGELAPGTPFYVKWPNDVFFGRAKVAGLLSEFTGAGLIVGIGLNLNMSEEELALAGQEAASVRSATGRTFDVMDCASRLERAIQGILPLLRDDRPALFARWRAANALIGRDLDFVRTDGTVASGVFHDVDADGALLLRTADGAVTRYDCGDLRIRRDAI